MSNLKKNISRILLLLVIFIITIFIVNQIIALFLPYGVRANDKRIKLNIPIIEKSMYSMDFNWRLVGNHWKSIRKTPRSNEVLHVWKTSLPLTNKGELDEEKDAFRRIDKNGNIQQLNIYTKIIGDSITIRRGNTFFINSQQRNNKELMASEIDSILNLWNSN